MARKYISTSQKLAILRDLDTRVEAGESLRAVARSHGVQGNQIRRWKANRWQLESMKYTSKTMHKGRKSQIKHLEERIITWALEMRGAGVGITYSHLLIKGARVDDDFATKTREQQYNMIRRLCIANCLVCRRKTHQAQKHTQEAYDTALQWLVEIRPLLLCSRQHQIMITSVTLTVIFCNIAQVFWNW